MGMKWRKPGRRLHTQVHLIDKPTASLLVSFETLAEDLKRFHNSFLPPRRQAPFNHGRSRFRQIVVCRRGSPGSSRTYRDDRRIVDYERVISSGIRARSDGRA